MPTLLPSARTHPWRWLLAVVVVTLFLAAAQRGYVVWRQLSPAELVGARWIWAAGALEAGEPLAFFAVRDFDLAEVAPSASLLIAADEVYVVWLNGRLVGSNSYRPGTPVDRYAVAPQLKPGGNRIVIELRSSRGAGGLLAALGTGASAQPELATDGSWRILRRYDHALLRNRPLDPRLGEPPVVWGTRPTGRWRPALAATVRPSWPQERRGEELLAPERWHEGAGEGVWQVLETGRRQPAPGGAIKLFDWGREVEGYLALELRPHSEQLGLLYLGSEPPEPESARPSELLIAVAGHRSWRSAHPHRFRYALLVGGDLRAMPRVEPLDPALEGALPARPLELEGVWGLEPALDRLKIEQLVWGEVTARPR